MVEIDSKLPFILSRDLLERDIMGKDDFGDIDAHEMVYFFDIASAFIQKGDFETLNIPIGHPSKQPIKETSKLELKTLSSHLKYTFFGGMTLCCLFLLHVCLTYRSKRP